MTLSIFAGDGRVVVYPKNSPAGVKAHPMRTGVCRRLIAIFEQDGYSHHRTGDTTWVIITHCIEQGYEHEVREDPTRGGWIVEKKAAKAVPDNAPAELKLNITTQGAPRVSHGAVLFQEGRLAALVIDMVSKRCQVGGIGGSDDGPSVEIVASATSLNLTPGSNHSDTTLVEFPEFAGWGVHSASGGKYTINVCLIKKD